VSGVCHYVAVELSRSEGRYETPERDFDEQMDMAQGNTDTRLINEERCKQVRKILAKLDDRDRKLLRAVFLEELGSSEVCRRFQVGPDYLRVLVFRAKARFKQAYVKGASAGA
jgi:DNA-directed RNA polymerase specialized sigma24 family protein